MDLLSNEEQFGELTLNSSVGNLKHQQQDLRPVGSDTPNFEEK